MPFVFVFVFVFGVVVVFVFACINRELSDLLYDTQYLVQKYIAKPLLIGGYKMASLSDFVSAIVLTQLPSLCSNPKTLHLTLTPSSP